MPFDGETYDRARDQSRLYGQMERVVWAFADGGWHSLFEAQEAIREEFGKMDSLTGISARVRDLRKQKFGGYTVERRADGGTHEYRVLWDAPRS